MIKKSFCNICAPGPHCGILCEVENGVITKIAGDPEHPSGKGALCLRGNAYREYIYREDRIKMPLLRTGERGNGEFKEISWDEAFGLAAEKLNEIKANYGAESVAFFSGYEKWYRPFLQRLSYSFGSPNYGTESSTCFTSSIMSHMCSSGHECFRPDLAHCSLFLGWCSNPFTGAPSAVGAMRALKKRGAKFIIVDPKRTRMAKEFANLHLRPIPGTDGALALSIGRELIINGWTDDRFIKYKVYGFEEYKAYAMDFTPEKAEEITGVPAEDIKLCAKMLHENGPVSINQSSAALAHHFNGMQNHRAVMALSVLLGDYDKEGAIIPGILTYAHSSGGFETLEPKFGFEVYPKDAPLPVGCERFPLWHKLVGEMQATDLARQITEEKPYPIKAVWAHGMNYRMFGADNHIKDALKKLDFFVDTDLFMTDTAKMADLVLPACSSVERSEFKVWPGGFCTYTEPVIEPLYESRSDTDIIFELAKRLDIKDEMLRKDYISCVRYMVRNTKINFDELLKDRQNLHKVPGFAHVVPGSSGFNTPTGKYELYSKTIEELGDERFKPLPTYEEPDDFRENDYPFVLCSGPRIQNGHHSRLHDVPSLRAKRPKPLVEMNTGDAEALGIEDGDMITVETKEGAINLNALLSEDILAGCVFIYHGYREADVNSIIPYQYEDPYTGFPGYRSAKCRVFKCFPDGK